jgi:hypothetical protein
MALELWNEILQTDILVGLLDKIIICRMHYYLYSGITSILLKEKGNVLGKVL